MGAIACEPYSDDLNALRGVVGDILDLDVFAFSRVRKRRAFRAGICFLLRFESRAVCTELRHKVPELDPVRDVQRGSLLGSISTECDRVGLLSKGGALQDSVLSILRDLRGLDYRGLFQELGRNRNDFGAFSLLQALKRFPQLLGTCRQVHSLALIPQISSAK